MRIRCFYGVGDFYNSWTTVYMRTKLSLDRNRDFVLQFSLYINKLIETSICVSICHIISDFPFTIFRRLHQQGWIYLHPVTKEMISQV